MKVESTSKMPVKLFGTIHTGVFLNSANAELARQPEHRQPDAGRRPRRHVQREPAADALRLHGGWSDPRLGPDHGVVAMDFFGGIPGFQTGQVMGLPRLLVAFARIESDRTALEVGQDHMILAPSDPTSLAAFAFPALFRSGQSVPARAAGARRTGADVSACARRAASWRRLAAI